MSLYVKLEKTDFVSFFGERKYECGIGNWDGNGNRCYKNVTGMGFSATRVGLRLTVAGQDRDKCLRESDGGCTEKPVPCKTTMDCGTPKFRIRWRSQLLTYIYRKLCITDFNHSPFSLTRASVMS